MTEKQWTEVLKDLRNNEVIQFTKIDASCVMVTVIHTNNDKSMEWGATVYCEAKHFGDEVIEVIKRGLRNVRLGHDNVNCGGAQKEANPPQKIDDIPSIKRSTLKEIKKSMSPGIASIFDMVIGFVDVSDVKKGTELSLTYQALAVGMLHGMFLGLTQLLDTENASDIGRRLEAIDLMKDETMESLRNLAAYGETRRDKVSRFMDDMEAFFNRGSGPC